MTARQDSGTAQRCRISCPRSGILPDERPFIILRISPNCLTSWLTCWTVVPDPLAIRSRREPLISSGRRRSSGRHREDDRLDAVELALVDLHLGELVAGEPRDHPQQRRQRAHLADPLELVEEVLERELVLAQLLLERLRLVLVDRLLGLLDERQDVAHAEDPLGHAVGVELLEVAQLLARGGEHDRLAGDRLDRQRGAAAGVAVELGEHDAVELRDLGELLGDVDRVLAGHRVDHQQHDVRAGRAS